MNPKVELHHFRANIKELICNLLTEKYKSQHNGLLPNWGNEEEIVVDDTDLPIQNIIIKVTTQSGVCFEEIPINSYIVTLDYNLYFKCGDEDDEYHWTEISTDELVSIHTMLEQNKKQ